VRIKSTVAQFLGISPVANPWSHSTANYSTAHILAHVSRMSHVSF